MTPPEHPPAFLFPGQLAEFVGMGRDFHESDREARELFALTSEKCGLDLETILFSGPEAALHQNLAAQAGVYLVSTLAARALAREGITPAATAGYSLGNYAALVAAGAISYEEGLDVLDRRLARDRAARHPRFDGRRRRRAEGSRGRRL